MKLLREYHKADAPAQDIVSDAARPSGGAIELAYIEDVLAMLGGRKSRWWIRHHFAPEARLKIGRTLAWSRADALRWITEQRDAR